MKLTIIRLAAFAALAVICFATLAPIELRPGGSSEGIGVTPERFTAFALLGALMAASFPRRSFVVVLAVIGIAVMLEALQLLIPSRHGQLWDALVKSIGGVSGVAAAAVLQFPKGIRIRRERPLSDGAHSPDKAPASPNSGSRPEPG